MGRGYSGNHPRYSGERYDAKQAYDKDLTASARLHYLENEEHDKGMSRKKSPLNVEGGKSAHTKSTSQKADFAWEGHKQGSHHKLKLGQKTPKPSEEEIAAMSVNQRLDDSFGMGQNTGSAASPMNNRVDRLRERAQKRSERSGTESGDYDYEDEKVTQMLAKAKMLDERSGIKSTDERSGELRGREMDDMMDNRPDSPFNACAKDEGGSGCIQEMGGAWRVISNKTDKPWPAKYGSKSKAESALKGYHAG